MGGRPRGASPRRRRRWGLAALAAGLVAAAVMVVAAPASGQEHGHDDHLPPGDWTDEQQMELHDLIARTEAELPAFADVTSLPALGFHDFGVTVGGWAHWINREWVDDDHILDPSRPESLVYRSTADGWVLEAAMFFLPTGTDMTSIPEDLAWMPGWHQHPDLCITPDWRYAGLTDMNGGCWSGAPSDMPPMMHVWLVDPGCGHRFGGIDVGGLHCDVGHGHGPHPTTPTTAPPAPSTTAPPTTSTSVAIDLRPDPGPRSPQAAPAARPARAVRGQPSYAG